MIKTLLAIGLSEFEIRAFLGVGHGRIARVRENRPKPPPKTPKHAVNDGDKKLIVEFILSLDLEPEYPCAHRSIPLYVEGEDQGSTWRKLHAKYKTLCEKNHSRTISYNRFREYVHHFFPTLKLGKTKTNLCNECFSIKLKLDDSDVSDEDKIGIKAKLNMHLGQSNTQRRAMNAYIELVKKKVTPNDPPFEFESCQVDDFCDEVLAEALELYDVNPVFDAKFEEVDGQGIMEEVEDEIEVDLNSNYRPHDYQLGDEMPNPVPSPISIFQL